MTFVCLDLDSGRSKWIQAGNDRLFRRRLQNNSERGGSASRRLGKWQSQQEPKNHFVFVPPMTSMHSFDRSSFRTCRRCSAECDGLPCHCKRLPLSIFMPEFQIKSSSKIASWRERKGDHRPTLQREESEEVTVCFFSRGSCVYLPLSSVGTNA